MLNKKFIQGTYSIKTNYNRYASTDGTIGELKNDFKAYYKRKKKIEIEGVEKIIKNEK